MDWWWKHFPRWFRYIAYLSATICLKLLRSIRLLWSLLRSKSSMCNKKKRRFDQWIEFSSFIWKVNCDTTTLYTPFYPESKRKSPKENISRSTQPLYMHITGKLKKIYQEKSHHIFRIASHFSRLAYHTSRRGGFFLCITLLMCSNIVQLLKVRLQLLKTVPGSFWELIQKVHVITRKDSYVESYLWKFWRTVKFPLSKQNLNKKVWILKFQSPKAHKTRARCSLKGNSESFISQRWTTWSFHSTLHTSIMCRLLSYNLHWRRLLLFELEKC